MKRLGLLAEAKDTTHMPVLPNPPQPAMAQPLRTAKAVLLFLALVSAATFGARVQGDTPSSSPSGQDSTSPPGQPVTVLVSVLSKSNTRPDLRENEFRLVVDGREQPIHRVINKSSQRFRVGLLVDISGSERRGTGTADWEGTSRLFDLLLRKGDLGFVAAFADRVKMVCDVTSDLMELRSAARLVLGVSPRGGTALYDAICEQCRDQFWRTDESKALVIITDGEDNASQETVESAVRTAQRAGVVIYSLVPRAPGLRFAFHRVGKNSEETTRKISADTGGVSVPVRRAEEVPAVIEKVVKNVMHLYAISFYPQAVPRDGKFHKIRVTCTRPGIRLSSQPGYYAPEK